MATPPANPLASGVTAELYRAAIGPRGQDYYLRHFTRFDADGKPGLSWHWPAYWATFNWLVYRRMWGRALGYVAALLGVALVVFGMGKLIFNYSDATALLLFLGLLTAAFVVPGLYANAWFYTHCNEKISAVLRSTAEVKEACEVLARQASNDRRWLVLALLNAVVLALAISVLSWFGGMDSPLSSIVARDERPLAGGESGQVRPVDKPPAAAVAEAPVMPAPPVPATPVDGPASPPPSAPASAPAAPDAASTAPEASPQAAAAQTPSAPPAMQDSKPAPAAAPAPPVAEPDAPAPAAAPIAQGATEAPAPAPAPAQPAAAAAPRPAAPQPLRYVWVLQVGAYAEESNALGALTQVLALGLEAGAESYDTAAGRLIRVRVGPFTRRAEAEQAAQRIAALKLPVLLIRQRP